VREGDRLTLGPFDLEFVAVNHSIPDALAVAIRTPAGMVLHTGDFKMDQLPLDNRITDLRAFARLGEEGVDLFLTDSTNAEVPGFTTPEQDIGPVLDRVFHNSQQRIIVACFASHVHRVQQILDAAVAHDRKAAYVGRSMVRNMAIARDLGYLHVPPDVLVDVKDLAELPPERQVLISTGSQGEPLSALRRMAHGDHPQVDLHDGDTVIFSATSIPGNERAVNETINRIYKLGADVITAADVPVHASGHGYQEELKLMLNLTKPEYVLPVHGDHRRLRLHSELAEAVGIPPKSIFRGENGLPLEIDSKGARFGDREQAGMIFVDGVDVGDIEDVALRDRRMLSADGIFIVVATVSEQDGRSVAPPEIIFRGVPFVDETDGFVEELRSAVDDSLALSAKEEIREIDLLQDHLHDDVAAFVYERLRRRPMVLPVVVEV
jgi:ribonuclease J